ncbi:MAG: hypothetical protein E7269_07060 [Lachnospiraceae bacterium]|nr:hypothetical protein [Lachnospiraceae bacterium]
MKLAPNESILCQALAITSLLGELNNSNFLQSKYYQNLRFSGNSENFRKILNASGLGNPATMQMFLYVLLVMPKEILKDYAGSYGKQSEMEINQLFLKLVTNVNTTYNNESNSDLTTINFYRHTRNAVSHSRCFYEMVNNVCYITFKDENPKDISKHCEFTIKTADVGCILERLQIQIMNFLNS